MEKQNLIKTIEEKRNSNLLIYITGDRNPFSTRIAEDVIPIFHRHLERIALKNKDRENLRISLFIYTRGGDMLTPLRLVKLIRSYCKDFEVLIPYRCHSAGTLITLGADKIVMTKLAELSPIDPTTMHPYNPQNPLDPKQRLEISVEDLNSYFLFAREMAKVKEEEMDKVFVSLVGQIHPLSLGNAYRTLRMGKLIAQKLLEMPKEKKLSEREIGKIIEEITTKICIHAYPITRDEAKDLGLPVEEPTDELEKDLWDLYKIYSTEMKLGIPFNPLELLEDKPFVEVKYMGAYIESSDLCDGFVFRGKIQKIIKDGKQLFDINLESSKWEDMR